MWLFLLWTSIQHLPHLPEEEEFGRWPMPHPRHSMQMKHINIVYKHKFIPGLWQLLQTLISPFYTNCFSSCHIQRMQAFHMEFDTYFTLHTIRKFEHWFGSGCTLHLSFKLQLTIIAAIKYQISGRSNLKNSPQQNGGSSFSSRSSRSRLGVRFALHSTITFLLLKCFMVQ